MRNLKIEMDRMWRATAISELKDEQGTWTPVEPTEEQIQERMELMDRQLAHPMPTRARDGN